MFSYLSRRRGLVLLLVLYGVLAVTYSVAVPIGRGADEWAHYAYVRFISEHGRLPLNPEERQAAGYKSDWPPLYHLLTAVATGWVDTAGPPAFKFRSDNIRRQLVPASGPEAIVHTEDELFPWRQEILVWHLARFLSIGFTLGTLVVTYGIGLEIFGELVAPGEARRLALASTAGLAFLPRFLFTGMLLNYDSLTLLLASLFLWLLIRVVRGYYPRWGFWGLGGIAGLALVTKYLAALLPLEILVVTLWAGRPQPARDPAPGPPLKREPFRCLEQAVLAFLLVTGWWFGYLLLNFNEIETYGPILGSVAPLLRGDGSDRTVDQLFALVSGGAAPPPAYIEQQHHTAWQILAEFPLTLWGVPSTRPYALTWFVIVMTAAALAAGVGLALTWRARPQSRFWLKLLLLHCALPLPFMLIRLFGARDALEAVQGRHLLFLSGPVMMILLVWGLYSLARAVHRLSLYALLGLVLTAALHQLIFMQQTYPALLPVRTTPALPEQAVLVTHPVRLAGGAELIAVRVGPPCDIGCRFRRLWTVSSDSTPPAVLPVSLFWRGGPSPAPEDYRVELALVDGQGQIQADWLAYQTQANYPTRAWEAGDLVWDDGWLPLAGLASGLYALRFRILGESGEVIPWQTLADYPLAASPTGRATAGVIPSGWVMWAQGRPVAPVLPRRERETVQFSWVNPDPAGPPASPPRLSGPGQVTYAPVSAGPGWANFIIGPDWPPGDYRLEGSAGIAVRVAPGQRSFQAPAIDHPLAANFEGQVKLLGYDLPSRRVRPGEGLPIVLYWQGLTWMGEDFVIFNRLLDNRQAGGQPTSWGGYDRLAREHYSTLLWAPGEIVTDGFAVPVAPDAPDGVYTLSLGWYRRVNGQAQSLALLEPVTGQKTAATAVSIGPIKVGGPPPGVTMQEPRPQTRRDALLADQIKLLGFDLLSVCDGAEPACSENGGATFQTGALESGQQGLKLTLYWQALNLVERDYTVFVHLRNAAGEIVAQKDSPPAGGAYPTSLWEAGEIIRDEMVVPLAGSSLPPGRYDLVAGMYDPTTGDRLATAGSPDGAVLLQSFRVNE